MYDKKERDNGGSRGGMVGPESRCGDLFFVFLVLWRGLAPHGTPESTTRGGCGLGCVSEGVHVELLPLLTRDGPYFDFSQFPIGHATWFS